MPRLHNSIRIDSTPEEVWAVVGKLHATPEWIPGITSADVQGETRVCMTADGGEIRERIFDYSAEGRTWSYEQSRVPLPIQGSRGTVRVLPNGSGAIVEWVAEFEAPDEVATMVDSFYKQTLETLRRRVETGETPATM
jgi:carbon monoxide dehydrogenase subunit G